MEICGHLKPLYGQTTGMNGLSLFAVCTPFGPVPMGDFNLEDITFRSKHKLDMSIVSVDPRGKLLLGDLDNTNTKIYNLLHPMDANYFADSHKESEFLYHTLYRQSHFYYPWEWVTHSHLRKAFFSIV